MIWLTELIFNVDHFQYMVVNQIGQAGWEVSYEHKQDDASPQQIDLPLFSKFKKANDRTAWKPLRFCSKMYKLNKKEPQTLSGAYQELASANRLRRTEEKK